MRPALKTAIAVLAGAALGAGAYFLFIRHSTPKSSPVFLGDNHGYELGFVDADGRRVSDTAGPLKLRLDPFALYINEPNQHTKAVNIDSHGLRGGEPGAGPKVAVLGGSATFGEGLPGDGETFAALLSGLDPAREYLNAGVIGYCSGQELALMIHRLDDLKPVAYVTFSGWNDLIEAIPQVKGRHRRADQFGFNTVFFFIQDTLAAAAERTIRKQGWHSLDEGTMPDVDGDALEASAKRAYFDNLLRMRTFARGAGAAFLVVFQPELGGKSVKTPFEQKVVAGWDQAIAYVRNRISERYRRFAVETREFCAENQIPFLDIGSLPALRDDPETLYYDIIHPNEKGHRLIAAAIHERLKALLTGPLRDAQGGLQ